jgi:DMSO reductase anchor subunit
MHPAFSVIFFTVATGAGYGVLVMLAVLAACGVLPGGVLPVFVMLGTALVLVTAGLLSSTLHLGRPERAWRAFSQWRSSWLSREGIASVVTYIPACLFGIGWLGLGSTHGLTVACAIAAAVCAIATLLTTGMIYASLKPIPQWHSPYTVPGYLIYALMSGATLLHALLRLFGDQTDLIGIIALACMVLGFAWKNATWRRNDALFGGVSANSATGLRGGRVDSIEWPHTEENYVMKEMGFRIARKHAVRLRVVVQVAAFAVPLILVGLSLLCGPILAAVTAVLAVIAQDLGLLAERWLFFAEAKHVVSLYYGR